MFNLKKLFAGIVTLAMIFGMMATSFAATPSDVQDSPNLEAIQTLGALNIMIGYEDGTFKPNDTIKRSEFAKVAVTALGLADVAEASKGATRFNDVPDWHWASGYINVAAQQGIIIGDDQGNFRPDETIKYQDAMTILVRMLGYEPSAQSQGGYPTGSMIVGTQLGLSKNVTNASGAVTRATVAQMTFNTLTVNLMEQTSFGSNPTYEVVNKTLLADKLNVEKITGQVTATANTRLTGSSSLDDNQVEIDGKIYSTGNLYANNLLGYNVTAYAKEDEATGEMVLLMITPNQNKNKTLAVTADNIDSIVERTLGGYTLNYWVDKENDKSVTKANIKSDAILIYNGQAEDLQKNLIPPEAGRITLLDTNRDDVYDIVFITNSSNLVVQDTSLTSYTITDKYGNPSLVLDPENSNIKFTITDVNGSPVKFEDLKEWDVLSYTKSLDGSLINVVVVRNKVEGMVTEISGEDKYINGTAYRVANNLPGEIQLNDKGAFYLDAEGKIAAVDTTSELSDNYAYLIAADISNDGFDKVANFKVFGKDGIVKVLKGAEKITVNGVTSLTGEQAIAALKGENNEVPMQVVTYELDASGLVDKINTARDKSTSPLDYYKGQFTLNYAKNGAIFKSASSKLDGIRVTSDTIIFDIPKGETDTDKYAVRNINMFTNEGQYDVLVYDVTEDLAAKLIVVTNTDGKTAEESSAALVSQITTARNNEDKIVDKLYAIQDGKQIELLAGDTNVLVKNGGRKLEQGDIIQFSTNLKGEIEKVTVLFDSDNKDQEFIDTETFKDMTLLYGQISKKFASSINVKVNGGAAENFSINGVNIYSYDSTKKSNNVTIATAGDLQKFDPANPSRVFLRIYKDELKEIIIIK